ncbi:PucR family transcriptional regulator [Kitasatospora sp. NPDC018058]|uniref:PucR family transcriptional regulator n=1 Tax=Kitasatospora sp. NPDC018058 TaxID=3364025 RepID=UPI0037C0BAAF
MIGTTDLVDSLGAGLLRVVVTGPDTRVHDVVLAVPGEVTGQPGELLLGVGPTGPAAAVSLVRQAGAAGAAGVVLKAPLADDPEVVAAARQQGQTLIELQPHASWSHVVWLVRGVIDRACAPQPAGPGGHDVHSDLFTLADAAAEIADAPVTVEDAQSRVLAYSGRQDGTDRARVSTIVGRRVPPELIAHFRARGLFRRLARSNEPVHVPAGPDGTLPRLAVPVRAGGEWLGAIWVVAATPVPPKRVQQLTDLASIVALHLLRLRAETGIARRVSDAQLRTVLRDGPGPGGPELPPPPWRVVALGTADRTEDVRRQLDLWESVVRRFGWHQPLLVDLDDVPFAVLTEPPRPHRQTAADTGSMPWLRRVLGEVRTHDRGRYAAAGGLARCHAELPRSRAQAAELISLAAAGRAATGSPDGVVLLEDAWDAVLIERARTALGPDACLLGGPLPDLRAHDEAHGTSFLPTLAAWLDHYGEPQDAARALRIHPNTLRYRLRRMAEVTTVDLSSPQVRLALRLLLGTLLDGPSPLTPPAGRCGPPQPA